MRTINKENDMMQKLLPAAIAAGNSKRVSMHTLRRSVGTCLLGQNSDIRVIQVLLSYKKLETTALDTKAATGILRQVIS